MSWGERLYGAAPASLQDIGLTLHGWRVKRHRYGHRLDAQLADLVEQETWTPDRLRALQARRLRRVIRHAFERSPFYRSRFEERGLTPKDIQTVEDLRKLPILTKDQVRARGSALMTGRPRRGCRRVIFVSSLAVVSGGRRRPITEHSPPEPDARTAGPYVWGKLEAERPPATSRPSSISRSGWSGPVRSSTLPDSSHPAGSGNASPTCSWRSATLVRGSPSSSFNGRRIF